MSLNFFHSLATAYHTHIPFLQSLPAPLSTAKTSLHSPKHPTMSMTVAQKGAATRAARAEEKRLEDIAFISKNRTSPVVALG